jgi:SAM-dependent methyltransferase
VHDAMNETEPDWRAANRANWDARTRIHLAPGGYDLSRLETGRAALDPIVEAELPDVSGRRVLHLQCHFGMDSLVLARRGAIVTGLDFSSPAIAAARELSTRLDLSARTRFVEADLYDALTAIPEPASFDLVYVTWGTICWLPDILRWTRIVASFIRPGGALYLAEAHPAACVLDDRAALPDGMPGLLVPYFLDGPFVEDEPRDYANTAVVVKGARQYTFMHSLGRIVTGLITSGLTLDWLHEHDCYHVADVRLSRG